MKQWKAIVLVIAISVFFAPKTYAAVIYTQSIYDFDSPWQGQMSNEATTTLAGKTVSYLSFYIKPNDIWYQDHFRVQAYGGSCNKVEDYTYTQFGIDYNATTTYHFITIPWSYTFPSDMTGCFFGIGQNNSENEVLKLSLYGGYNGSREPNWSFCDSVDCPLYTNGIDMSGVNRNTRIINIQPETGTTTGNLVNFAVHAYISPADVGNVIKIRMVLHNIDQNVLLLDFLSPSDIYLFDGLATTTGDWYFSTSTYIGDGNYRFNVTMDSCASALGQCVLEVPFFGVHIDESTQFIVNQASFLGNISQNLFRDIQKEFASTSATSTASLAQNCNPLHFDIKYCMTYLFIPDAGQLSRTFLNFRDGVLVKAPIGWIYRITSLMASSTATTSLPVISYTFQSDSPLYGNTLAFDTNNYFTQAATIVSEATSNTDHKTVWEILQPIVDLFIYLFLGFVIFGDITNIDWHTRQGGGGSGGVSREAYRYKEKLYEMSQRT